MSSAAISPASSAETNPIYFLLRRLHSLTGIVFGLYICVHLLVNATLIQGPANDVPRKDAAPAVAVADAARVEGPGSVKTAALEEAHGKSIFQQQVDKIHSLPFLLAVEMSAIFLPLVIHTVYGIYITINGKPNQGNYPYVKNWFYVMQRVTAVILVAFIFFHVGAMFGWFGSTLRFEPDNAYQSTVRHLQANPILWLIVYPLGVIAGTFHLANGFWTAGIAWGLTVSKKAQLRWGWVCVGLFLFTTACGFASILATLIYKNQVL